MSMNTDDKIDQPSQEIKLGVIAEDSKDMSTITDAQTDMSVEVIMQPLPDEDINGNIARFQSELIEKDNDTNTNMASQPDPSTEAVTEMMLPSESPMKEDS